MFDVSILIATLAVSVGVLVSLVNLVLVISRRRRQESSSDQKHRPIPAKY